MPEKITIDGLSNVIVRHNKTTTMSQQTDSYACGLITAENGKDFLLKETEHQRLKQVYKYEASCELRKNQALEINEQ